ncbi:LysR family transcriptional regulator [Pseudomaricurvus alkylphenolicus]|jgi:DNA-binding transcriptional LysR family regulator|uniref:LysR family transcriptional regulator n=1 Tax=Pseudomaricurvus alkylphenolicus TaxID=1306991 RepID=UPI001422848B|nr:LysR family transcriptional regulator [Pseudomaricurvus alkylphenolicus]NIB38756.1 LysR family transcriptional regulator [Pseudomaricurvus alkylphenolicus]
MTPKQLTYFTRIAECGSFAAASKDLHIAQPALSQQIANLETQLGVELFYRKPRGVELTESGKRLMNRAYGILREIESTVLDIQSADLQPSGELRVGIVPAINNVMASQLVSQMEQRYPQVELEVISGASRYLNQQLEGRKIDICIVHPDSGGFGDFTTEPLLREELFFVGAATNSYPHIKKRGQQRVIRFADIAHYVTLSTEVHDGLGFRVHQYEEETGVELNKKRSYGQLLTDLNVILEGQAQMILPWSAFFHLAGDKRLVIAKIVEPVLHRDVFMLTSPSQPLTNTLIKSQSLIKELVGDIFVQGRSVGESLV